MREKITGQDNSATLVLTSDILSQLGLRIGDEVDVTFVDGALMVRPAGEATRDETVSRAVDDVFARRRDALQHLAQ